MPRISMLLPVYNEERLLRYSLQSPIKYVDEIIVVDGSPWGPSTDGTKAIIDEFDKSYPGKIKYLSGVFSLPDGAWDESTHRNLGLQEVTGDFLMPHCGDMLYSEIDIIKLVQALNKFPERKIFYCLFIEFWLDYRHIRLYGGHAMEAWFPVPAISDIPIVSMDIVKEYERGPNLVLQDYNQEDFLFVPDAFRYHYGWISGFRGQVQKHIRNMTMGAWPEPEYDLRPQGESAIAKWAVKHVLSYPDMSCSFDYCGYIPVAETFTYLDGYEEVLAELKGKYGEAFLDD